jgi:hypothetical protein
MPNPLPARYQRQADPADFRGSYATAVAPGEEAQDRSLSGRQISMLPRPENAIHVQAMKGGKACWLIS